MANTDYKQLAKIDPALIEKNWFKKLKDVPENIQQWYLQKVFIFGTDRIARWKPDLPQVEKTEIPENPASSESLLKLGISLYEKAKYKQALYAFSLAGEKGLSDGYFWCGVIYFTNLSQYEYAVAFFKRALDLNPNSQKTKHELGRVYLEVGLWKEGIFLIQNVADTEQKNKELLGFATYNMARFYREGICGMKKDPEKAAYYLKKSADAGLPLAIELQKKQMQKK